MSCPSENQLLDAIDGRLSAAERSDLDHHVEGCEICRELVDATINTTRTLIESSDARGKRLVGPKADALLGTTVGEYVVEQVIGSGGMGIVYRGSHPLIGKPVAIKILRPELAADAGHVRRMLSEARAMSSIAHRSIVDVFAFGELADGRQYMVMEFLQGQPLNQIIRTQAPMPTWKLLPLLDGILEALAASHAAGVIHRDLKPSNLYVVEQTDGTRFVKLLDFGLAKRELDDQGHTRAGRLVMGTPGYMAPEQIRAEEVSHATDLYALGVIAYELATAKRPFRGRDPLEVMRQQVEVEPPAPSTIVQVAPEIEALILSLMQKDPKDRPVSAEIVRHAISRLSSAQPSRLQTEDSMPAVQMPKRRRPTWQLVTGGAGLAALALIGVVAASSRAADPVVQPQPKVVEVVPVVVARVEPVQVVDAGEVAAPIVKGPPPPPQPRLTQKQLLERAGKLRKRLAKATPRGEEPDPMATMLLNNAERDVRAARGDAELKRMEKTLADIERKYFKR